MINRNMNTYHKNTWNVNLQWKSRIRSPVVTSACSRNQVSRPSEFHYHKFKIVVNVEPKNSKKNIVYCEWLFDYKKWKNRKTEQNQGDEHFGQRLDQI